MNITVAGDGKSQNWRRNNKGRYGPMLSHYLMEADYIEECLGEENIILLLSIRTVWTQNVIR